MAASKTKRSTKSGSSTDALSILEKDHRLVEELFRKLEREDEASARAEIVQQICSALTTHATVEEEIFYPAVREHVADEKSEHLLDEAEVEHEGIKSLVEQLEDMKPGDPLYDGRLTVLKEYVRHHVEEEEHEMFPKVKKSKAVDLEELGTAILARKTELEPAQDGEEPADSERKPVSKNSKA